MSSSGFREFIPKSYLYLHKGYTFSSFKRDLLAGITVGIIALPLAMAFAISSGVSPERGLYTAIIGGFLISALGGSRIQIGGPTGAFVVIVYGIIQNTGYAGLCASTLVASCLLVLLGVFRIGSWIKYVPYPLITGFTTGIALLIFSTQIKDFFGLDLGTVPADFIEKWASYVHAFSSLDPFTTEVSVGTLTFIVLMRRFFPSFPWGIGAIVLATCVCQIFHVSIATIESSFGQIPSHLPIPSFSEFSFSLTDYKQILMNGITIAFLGGIESLLSAVIGDGMIGGKHRSNCELVAQGIANFGSVLFGGIPATGAIARTAANVKTGAKTPLAGMIHALFLLCILLFFAPWVSKIPLAALAAVLIMVSWNMSEAAHFIRLCKAPFGDRMILLTAFFLTVFVDITVAITVGMILASFLFMKRMSDMSKAVPLSEVFKETQVDFPEKKDPDNIASKQIPEGVEVYEIQGPFFFGAANILRDLLQVPLPKAFILRMRSVPMIDASGMHALKEFYDQCRKNRIALFLSGIHGRTRKDLENFGLAEKLGEERIAANINEALDKVSEFLERGVSE
jgi:SulP family sulfate permease